MNFYDGFRTEKRIINGARVLLLLACVVWSPWNLNSTTRHIRHIVQQNDATVRDKAAQDKAAQVLKQAQEIVRKNLKNTEIKGLIITSRRESSMEYSEATLKAIPKLRNQRMTSDDELGASWPDKIRNKTETTFPNNQQIQDSVLNGDRYSEKSDVFAEGKLIVLNMGDSKPKSEKEKIAAMKNDLFLDLFSLALDYSWYPEVDFKFIGVAEAAGAKADTIEATLPGGRKYRLFFDQQTHLLLLASETKMEANKEVVTKYFFSAYREEDGLLIAHTITTEKDGNVTGEKQIKRLVINPTFKPDYFAIKGK